MDRDQPHRHEKQAQSRRIAHQSQLGQQEKNRQRDAAFDRVHEERIAKHVDGRRVQQTTHHAADPQLIVQHNETLRVVEPEIQRGDHAPQERQRLTGDSESRLQHEIPAGTEDCQRARTHRDGQHDGVLEDPETHQPDNQPQHPQPAADHEHPLDAARIQQRLEHPAKHRSLFFVGVCNRRRGIEEFSDLRWQGAYLTLGARRRGLIRLQCFLRNLQRSATRWAHGAPSRKFIARF